MKGTSEILTNNGATSAGIVLDVATVADVPMALQYGHRMTGFRAATKPRTGVDAEWTATMPDGGAAVVLWRIERDLTIQEIAAAIEAAGGEGGD